MSDDAPCFRALHIWSPLKAAAGPLNMSLTATCNLFRLWRLDPGSIWRAGAGPGCGAGRVIL